MADLISRQDAIEVMACEMYAESQAQGYDIESWEDFIPEARAWMSDCPSARPTGRWTKIVMTLMNNQNGHLNEWECDQCHEHQLLPSNFCPNCGADMRGDNE